MSLPDDTQLLYLRLASHYQGAIESGSLTPGDRMPSVRSLTRLHKVSLSTALQACHYLEDKGWLEARPRSGYFVRRPRRVSLQPNSEPEQPLQLDAAQYLGIHERVSEFIASCELYPLKTNLAQAFGSPDAYPTEALKHAATRALRSHPEVLVEPTPWHGESGFRAVLARRALDHGMRLTPDDIVVTHGCTEAVNLALRAVTQAGDTVAVESPCYFGLLQIVQSLGLRSIEIPTSPHTGMSIEALELALQTQPSIRAVVVVPNFQNPLGSVMPDAHKERLVALCAEHGKALIEDDSYSALCDAEQSLRAVQSWDTDGTVIYCASLHKTLAPGMRLGWITGGRWHARIKMLKFAQSRPNDALSQLTVGEFMASSAYDRHMTRLRNLLRERRERTAESIAAHFPAGTRLSMPRGGMLLWVQLPPIRSPHALFEQALREGIRVAPGWIFSNSSRYDNYLRINCGIQFTAEVDAAIERLAALVYEQLV
ncbi:PLP-dependent aminotransferase family protein [Uliginosibacterium sediminicola]|uniref:PLP-dependent aminotransferase family protein n=1 Tax=Uliginosibacterium sediminicola TaxID=2024550 RepID=A0ABU9Z2M7_9RHOO